MAKVIVERPRRAGWGGKGDVKRAQVMGEELPNKEGMRKWHVVGHSGKELNENLRPLERFLGSRVGRKWDEVFSEICEHMSFDNAVQRHIYQHLTGYVQLNVIMVNGVPHEIGYNGMHQIYRDFYVHPDTGILCKAPKYYKKYHPKPEVPKLIKTEEPNVFYAKRNGLWYMVRVAPFQPIYGVGTQFYDKCTQQDMNQKEITELYGSFSLPVEMRQLNGKLIEKLGLHQKKVIDLLVKEKPRRRV